MHSSEYASSQGVETEKFRQAATLRSEYLLGS